MTSLGLGDPGGNGFVSVKLETRSVEKAVKRIPRTSYFWLRAYMFAIAKEHRKQWLRNKGTKFGRVSKSGRGIIVSRVNEGQTPPRPNEVSYQVSPKEERQSTDSAARRAIGKLRADIFTGNKILPVHEFGIDIQSQGWMAVPIRTRPGNIQRWRERNPQKTLITLPSKKDPRTRTVYEVQIRRKRGRVSKDWVGPPPVRQKLRLRFILTREVKMNRTLKLYDNWDQLQSAQDDLWQRFADRLLQDLKNGVKT